MENLLKQIHDFGVIPVVKLEDSAKAGNLAKALCEGGLPCAEITFRTESAAEVIRLMLEKMPQMLVGAGTVLNTNQVDAAIAAGAQFIVSPGLNPKTVKYCQSKEILSLPGCITPSEIEQAIELGLHTVKFFPAEAAGGLPMIKALTAPYGQIKFMPTGGITLNNLADYLQCSAITACGGSFMVSESLIENNQWDEISRLTAQAVKFVKRVRGIS